MQKIQSQTEINESSNINEKNHLKKRPMSETNFQSDNESTTRQPSLSNGFANNIKKRSSRLDFSNILPTDFQKSLKKNVEQYHEISQNLVFSASSLSKQFSSLVASSQGREKVLTVLQYWGEFQCTLAKHSNIPGVQELYAKRMLASVRFMFVLKEQLSQARKTFRLLKFLDDFKGIQQVIQTKKPFLFKMLGVCALYCSFMYYMTDNILFSIQLFISGKIFPKEREQKWKDRKNSFSLLRILFSIARHIWSLYMRHKKESQLQKLIEENNEKEVTKEDKMYDLCMKLINKRRKRRFEWMELTIDICRFFMLYKSLKLVGYRNVDPVYIGFCGVASSIMSLMKMIIDKKIFVSIQNNKASHNDNNYVGMQKVLNAFKEIDQVNQSSQNLRDFDGLVGNQFKINKNIS